MSRALARLENSRRRGATVMAISNIERRDTRKLILDKFNVLRLDNDPGGVPHSIGSDEIDVRSFGQTKRNKLLEDEARMVHQKHRSGLSFESFDVAHAIVFLFWP